MDAKRLAASYFEMWNSGDADLAAEILHPEWFDHAHPEVVGVAGVQDSVRRIRAARPDLRFRVDDMLADGDRVAVLGGVEPQAAGAEPSNLLWLIRIADGLAAEMWTYRRS